MRLLLREPRAVLADGLLRWGGQTYLEQRPVATPPEDEATPRADPSGAGPDAPPQAPLRAAGGAGRRNGSEPRHAAKGAGRAAGPKRPAPPGNQDDGDGGSPRAARGRRLRLPWPPPLGAVTVVGGVTAAAFLTTALVVADPYDRTPAGDAVFPPAAPAPTVTVTTSVPDASTGPGEPGEHESAEAPTRSPSVRPSPTASSRPGATAAPPPGVGDGYTPLVNLGSGLCLEVADGTPEKRADVVMARCASRPTQRWRLDERGLVHVYADPSFCLDSRGDTDRGVGIWPCTSADGDNGVNLRFVTDALGVIRPAIAPGFALSPDGSAPGAPLGLEPAGNDADQRWTTG
ncbi:ricin-type beta-trefoil lectin domain protein [Streptomyces sp. JJ36]|nr:ricin-type beta-trefoil lectin domain protein [Streptomyces sp. JJ36]